MRWPSVSSYRRNQKSPPLATDGDDVLVQRLRSATGTAEPQLADVKIRVDASVRLDRRAKPLLSAPVSRELQRLPAVTKGLDEQRTRTPKPRTRREAAERQPSSANASYHRRPPLHDAEPREARCVCGVLPRRQRLEGPAEPPAVKADELHHRLAVAPVV